MTRDMHPKPWTRAEFICAVVFIVAMAAAGYLLGGYWS